MINWVSSSQMYDIAEFYLENILNKHNTSKRTTRKKMQPI